MTLAALLAGLLLPIVASAAVIRAALPVLWLRSPALVISLAAVAGIGCSSLLFASILFAVGARAAVYVPFDIAFWAVLVVMARRATRGRARSEQATPSWSRPELAARLVFIATLAVSLLHFYWTTVDAPSGEWDAWAIWNLRARFLHRGLDGHWRDGFDAALNWSHANYPLLLPSSTARLWLFAGGESAAAPIALAFVFQYASVGMLVGACIAAGRRLEGFLAGAVLAASYPFNVWGPAQVSDVPVAAFVLAGTVLLAWIVDERRASSGPAAALLTFVAGCAAWTKNEGLVFMLASGAVLASVILLQRKATARALVLATAGAVWPLAVLVYFKSSLAPPSYLLESLGASAAPSPVWDLQRHTYILESFARELWAWSATAPIGIIPLVVAYGVAASMTFGLRRLQLVSVIPLLAMLAGYYAAYVITPLDLRWHVETSLSRLLVQIWPAAVYVLFSVSQSFTAPFSSLTR